MAEHYPGTSPYRDAVRKAALIYCDPLNPAANDSIALYWLGVYGRMKLTMDEERMVRDITALLQRVKTLRQRISRGATTTENLNSEAKKRTATLNSQARRIQELEEELQRTNQELKRLKDVDLQMSRRRQKK